jgi:hypothetical protein
LAARAGVAAPGAPHGAVAAAPDVAVVAAAVADAVVDGERVAAETGTKTSEGPVPMANGSGSTNTGSGWNNNVLLELSAQFELLSVQTILNVICEICKATQHSKDSIS